MKCKKGMTIVEVMVAFVILLIGLAGLYKVTVFAGQQVHKAVTVKKEVDNLMEGYYTGDVNLAKKDQTKTPVVKFVLEGYEGQIKQIPGAEVEWTDYISTEGYHLQSFLKKK